MLDLTPYQEDRFRFLNDLQSYLTLHKRTRDAFLRFSYKDVRFSLGEINKEIKIPIVFGHYFEKIVLTSLKEIVALIRHRHEEPADAKSSKEEKPSLKFSSAPERQFAIPFKSFRTSVIQDDGVTKEAIEEILEQENLADASLLAYWFSKKSNGIDLVNEFEKFYAKIIAEEIKIPGNEPTAYLGHLALIKFLRGLKGDLIKRAHIQGVSFERLDRTLSVILYVIVRRAIHKSISGFEKKQLNYDLIKLEYSLSATTTPIAFISADQFLLKDDYNPYHINWDFYDSLSACYNNISDKDKISLSERQAALLHEIKEKKGLFDKVLFNAKLIGFRHAVLNYLFKNDNQKDKANNYLLLMLQESKFLEQALFIPAEIENCENVFNILTHKSSVDEKLKESSKEIEEKFRLFKLGYFKTKFYLKPDEEALKTLNNFICLYEDIRINNLANMIMEQFEDFKGKLSEEELAQEYEKGRLYRFSTDDRETLKELLVKKEGQLFIDLKGYTKRTYKAKEIIMADFMRKEFYVPILNAAKKYYVGFGPTSGAKDVGLNNLLGDAAAFSGPVFSLVMLAEDIQNIIKEYANKLKRFEHDGIAADNGDEKTDSSLDAGLFISYGRAAEIIKIEDEVWGESKVAIAEKINEAARGTARNLLLKRRITNLIKEEEEKRKKGNLSYPFSVFIDKNYTFNFNADMSSAFELALKKKDTELAKKLSQLVSNLCYNDICDVIKADSGSELGKSELSFLNFTYDIYNLGEAMSDEAMTAYLYEVKDKKNYFKKVAQVSELHNDLLEQFVFPEKTIKLIICTEKYSDVIKVDLFRHAGEIKFKGFEEKKNDTMVFEIIRKDLPFYKMLMKHHINDWVLEAKKAGYESEMDIYF